MKSGWRTTEFWLTGLACTAGAAEAWGAGSLLGQIAGMVTMGLATFGYTCGRSFVKGRAALLLSVKK